ncbi:MAG: ABC transporter ATP-binding protein [Clostridia bacterium]|nr:ABC transporter ATP-binding protein [Clostridia bacterium]
MIKKKKTSANNKKAAMPQGATYAQTGKKVLKYLKKYRVLFSISLILAIAIVALTLYIPVLVGEAIDLAIGKNNVDFKGIYNILLKIGIVAAITALLQWLMNVCNNRITFGIVRRLRRDAFNKIQELPLSYIDSHPVGDTVSRVISDADQFSDGLLMGFSQLFTGVLTIIGTIAFMVSINLSITLVVILVTPLSLFVAAFIAKNTHSLFAQQSKTRAEQTAFIDEMIGEQKVVAAFSHEDEAIEQFDEINGRLAKCSLKAVFYSSLTNPCTRFVNNLVYAGVALVGALICVSGKGDFITGLPLTVGALTSLLSYANQYTKPFNEISGVVTELQNAIVCAARVFELIDAEPQMPDAENAYDLKANEVDGRVRIENVEFSYTPERELIKDFNLSIENGQRVAIVGPTGCGKTTVINLLMRFYDVDSGKIEVSGHDIRDLTRSSLRRSYGMVLQDTWLKTGTIRENIAMGKPDATDEEIKAAAKEAHAHSFIRQLPKGYDTVIGEDGGALSQGQKQLLCIARVLLCLPPMLILDEATSSIDTRTEMKIQDAFAKMMKGRTSFVVAHRLSTIKEADVILVMNNGKIVEKGNHAELLKNEGFYADLWNSQFEN